MVLQWDYFFQLDHYFSFHFSNEAFLFDLSHDYLKENHFVIESSSFFCPEN